jgi:hypothetical protein
MLAVMVCAMTVLMPSVKPFNNPKPKPRKTQPHTPHPNPLDPKP